ncbi:unnamed protein product [marine sediment metagenome]|uniref:Uncharacterized protein n=1 Tax=marine sediment metagenome TaxID=412755 RepID=X0V4H0_9ZZZZ
MKEIKEQEHGKAPQEKYGIVYQLEKDFPNFFKIEKETFGNLGIIKEHEVLIPVMDEIVAFTRNEFFKICSTRKPPIPASRREIEVVTSALYKLAYLDLETVQTGLNPAEIFFDPTNPASPKLVSRMKSRFMGYSNARNIGKSSKPDKKDGKEDSPSTQYCEDVIGDLESHKTWCKKPHREGSK